MYKNILLLTLFVSSSFAAEMEYSEKYVELVDLAKQNISSQLKDPYSAKFENIFIGKSNNDSPVVCGYVNAKNGFGGYMLGEKSFIS